MTIFLAPCWYVSVPIETTHEVAWRGTRRRGRELVVPPLTH
jgi:hypothetical protein